MNIYEYAWLDPINASDPSGLYTCDGTEEECERISNYVDQARREARREAFRSIMPRTMNYARALSRFYGAEGEDNNVVVRNADLPEGIPGETVPPSRSGRIEIRFDLEAIQSHEAEGTGFGNLTGMAVAIHEGWHGVQFRGPWTTATYTPLYEMERSAYRAEFYGLRAARWEPFVAMTPREREEWIRRQAHRSTQAARARRGY